MNAGVKRHMTWFDVLNYSFLFLLMFVLLYPFINQLAISLNDGKDASRGGIYFLPRKLSFDSYIHVLGNPNLIRSAFISVLRVVVGTGTSVFATGLLAYLISQKEFSARKWIRLIFIFTMYFSGGLIPFYLLIMRLRLMNTFHVYWIPSLLNPFYMMLIAAYIMDLPDSLTQSARIDGASEFTIYMRIILPISLPVFATIAIYSGVGHWNSWFDVALYNPGKQWDTLQIILQRLINTLESTQKIADSMRDAREIESMARNISSISVRAATTMVVTIPIICIYPFFQKFFIGGLTTGAVKG